MSEHDITKLNTKLTHIQRVLDGTRADNKRVRAERVILKSKIEKAKVALNKSCSCIGGLICVACVCLKELGE